MYKRVPDLKCLSYHRIQVFRGPRDRRSDRWAEDKPIVSSGVNIVRGLQSEHC